MRVESILANDHRKASRTGKFLATKTAEQRHGFPTGRDGSSALSTGGHGNDGGSGAVRDAVSVPDGGPVNLYAMADVIATRPHAWRFPLRGPGSNRLRQPLTSRGNHTVKKSVFSCRFVYKSPPAA